MRKIFFVIILSTIIIAAVFLGYFIWQHFHGEILGTVNKEEDFMPIIQKTAPSSSTSNLQRIVDRALVSYLANASSGELFLIDREGKINQQTPTGVSLIGSGQGLQFNADPQLSANRARILIATTIFDLQKKTWLPLPEKATVAAWHPQDGNQLAYLTNEGLFLFNVATKQSSLVAKFNNLDWQISWPFAEDIYFTQKISDTIPNAIWSFNLKTKTLQRFPNGESHQLIQWSPDGRWGLAYGTNTIVDRGGTILINLAAAAFPGFTALPQKCTVVKEGVYCAVARTSQGLTIDTYAKRNAYTVDDFYFVSMDMRTRSASVRLIFSPNPTSVIDATQLTVNPKKLFFINRYDRRLYQLALP